MINRRGLIRAALTLLFAVISLPAFAQFEGKIVFNTYDVSTDGTQNQSDQFSLFLTKDRILLEGSNRYNFVGSIQTEGVLVRLDFEDFVFLTGEETALKISKQDIDAMMSMFGNQNSTNGNPGIDREVNYRNTGETKTLNGYTCEKFIFTDQEEPGDHAEVWMTKELSINWGMLAEPWGSQDLNMIGDQLSFDLMFKEGYFPLRMEGYESGNLRQVTEVKEIEESNVAKAMVQVPQGVKILSFQDYLFNKMSQQ